MTNKPESDRTSFKERAYIIIFQADTRAGKLFDLALICCILCSVTVVMLDSIESVAQHHGALLKSLEWAFTLLFTLEYGLRIWCARAPVRYVFSFFGLVDFLSTLPTYIALLIPGGKVFLVIRALRLLRIFRIMKLVTYSGEAQFILKALSMSRRKIMVFLYAVLILVILIGSAMYLIEGGENGFTSIPRSVYWAVVTLTTVGYGDISPQTPLGQTLATFVMLLGYSIIAVPTGIVTSELQSARRTLSPLICTACKRADHESDALHCRHCGARLSKHIPR